MLSHRHFAGFVFLEGAGSSPFLELCSTIKMSLRRLYANCHPWKNYVILNMQSTILKLRLPHLSFVKLKCLLFLVPQFLFLHFFTFFVRCYGLYNENNDIMFTFRIPKCSFILPQYTNLESKKWFFFRPLQCFQ